MNNNDFIEYEPDAETVSLIKRYEDVVHRKSRDYFDEEEFEVIIDHYLSINKSKEAIAAADRGSAQYPYSSELKLRYAEILIIRGEAARALQLLQQVAQMGVNDSDIHFLKARAYIRQKKFKEAEIHFEKSRQMEEREEEVLRILFSAASDWIDAKEYRRAIDCFRQLLDINPQSEYVYVLNDMAYCYELLDELENAAYCYEQCININPFNETAWYNLGNIYSIQEDYEKAIQAFDFSIAIDGHNSPVLFNRATTLIQLERFRDAVDTFTEYLEIDPGNTYVLCTIAECYENMDNPAMALNYYAQALEVDPECADAYYGQGLILMEQQDYNQAFDCMTTALHIDDENAEYYYGLGVLLLRIDAGDMARQVFLRAVHFDPSDTETWLILSELVGPDLHKALGVLNQACVHNPDDAAIHFRKAALYFILEDKEACLASLERALAIDPSDDNDFLAICPEAMTHDDINALYSRYKYDKQ